MKDFILNEQINLEKIKQLENENQILRQKLLNELKNHIDENTKLRMLELQLQ